jgi:hypothetical protein
MVVEFMSSQYRQIIHPIGEEIGSQFTMNEMIKKRVRRVEWARGLEGKEGSNSSCPETTIDLYSFVEVREMRGHVQSSSREAIVSVEGKVDLPPPISPWPTRLSQDDRTDPLRKWREKNYRST